MHKICTRDSKVLKASLCLIQGTVIRRWGQLGKGVDGATQINLAIFANNLCVANNQIISQVVTDEQKEQFRSFWEHHEQDELEGRNQLMASFCPQVYGLFLVKLAVRYDFFGEEKFIS